MVVAGGDENGTDVAGLGTDELGRQRPDGKDVPVEVDLAGYGDVPRDGLPGEDGHQSGQGGRAGGGPVVRDAAPRKVHVDVFAVEVCRCGGPGRDERTRRRGAAGQE
jgi:hypothetical protein